MALKAVLILAAIGLAYSESHCSAFDDGDNDGRDCTCGDKAFSNCLEPVTDDEIHVANLEECKFQCDLFASFGACDWFLYVDAGMDENCHLFGPGLETMSDYLSSCNIRGQPTKRKDDTCIMDPSSIVCDVDRGYCPNGCAPCDSSDPCEGYVETGCTMTTEGTSQINAPKDPEGCQALASPPVWTKTSPTPRLTCRRRSAGPTPLERESVTSRSPD